MLVKDDPFKRPKTPERTPNKKPTVDKENYVIPTLSSISASVNNSKISKLSSLCVKV